MIVRVDEVPHCLASGKRAFDWEIALPRLLAAIGAPIGLAVVRRETRGEWADAAVVEQLRQMENVYLLSHGIEHQELKEMSAEQLATMREVSEVVVPPRNLLGLETLRRIRAAGFTTACTGPETRYRAQHIKFEGIREVPSMFYGRLHDRRPEWDTAFPRFREWDCVTLHLGWEYWNQLDWEPVRAFGDRYRTEIRPWSEFLATVKGDSAC